MVFQFVLCKLLAHELAAVSHTSRTLLEWATRNDMMHSVRDLYVRVHILELCVASVEV